MRIVVHRAGGVAGMRIGGEIDTAELDADLAGRAERLLASPPALPAPGSAPPGSADLPDYEISGADAAGQPVHLRFSDAGGPSEAVAVAEELLRAIIRKRKG